MLNKKQFYRFIGIIGVITTAALGIFRVFEKSWLVAIIIFSLLVIYFGFSFIYWLHRKIKSSEVLKKENKQLKGKVKVLEKNICSKCKRIYWRSPYGTFSFDENMRDYFSMINALNNGFVYQFGWYIFIYFKLQNIDKDLGYLIDFADGSIYLPLEDKWEVMKGKQLLSKIFCSERTNHFSRIKFI